MIKYEIWDMVDDMGEFMPLFLFDSYDTFHSAFMAFRGRADTIPCAIIINNDFEEKKTYIYESPDEGKTVFRREFGKYDKREKVS